jgi:L-threonylcarbamoyladenylate synthase
VTNLLEEKKESKIFKANDRNIQIAAKMLHGEELVAFPTETVYGLGALALSEKACAKIFEIKNRPLTDPIIVHVHNLQSALALIDQSDVIVREIF